MIKNQTIDFHLISFFNNGVPKQNITTNKLVFFVEIKAKKIKLKLQGDLK